MENFDTLAYEKQIQQISALADNVLAKYGLNTAQKKLLQYEDNTVFRIETRGGEMFVLRISSLEGYSKQEQFSEIQWLSAICRETDLSIPEPVLTKDGASLVMLATETGEAARCCVLFRWIPGNMPTKVVAPPVAERMGEITATLHQHAKQFVLPPAFTRPDWGWDRLFGGTSIFASECIRGLSADERLLFATIGTRVREQLDQAEPDSRDWGLIHADLHYGNIVIQQKNIGVIDFDDCGWGYFLLDVATILSSAYRFAQDEKSYAAFRQAYLRGYKRIRPLPSQLETSLALFLIMRDMVIVNFVLHSQNEQVLHWGKARVKGIMGNLALYLTEGSYPGL